MTRLILFAALVAALSCADAQNSNAGGGASNSGSMDSTSGDAGATSGGGGGMSLKTKSGSALQVLGQSGKITLSGAGGSGEAVTITMDYIREVDANGNEVGKSGPNAGKHSRETFASTSFTFGELYSTSISGVAAQAVEFNSKLINDAATLTVQTILFTENGTIAPSEGERYNVSEGDMKFNVVISNWPFCAAADTGHPCNGAVGEFVDFAVAIEGPRAPDASPPGEARASNDDPYTLGDGAEFILSKKVNVDGTWEDMADGFPKVSSDGIQYVTALRFPKHTSSALYDPVVRSAGSASSTSSCSNAIACGLAALSPGAIAGIVIAAVVVLLLVVGTVYILCCKRTAPSSGAAVNKA